LHDEGLIDTFANKTRDVHLDDETIEVCFFPHGGTDVKQESSTDGKILQGLKHQEAVLPFAVIGKIEVAGSELREWFAVGIGCMKGKGDFVDGNAEAVRCSRGGLSLDGLGKARRCERKQDTGQETQDESMLHRHPQRPLHCRTGGSGPGLRLRRERTGGDATTTAACRIDTFLSNRQS
jgi:hypothetical protein